MSKYSYWVPFRACIFKLCIYEPLIIIFLNKFYKKLIQVKREWDTRIARVPPQACTSMGRLLVTHMIQGQ